MNKHRNPQPLLIPMVSFWSKNKHDAVIATFVMELPKILLNQCLPDLLRYEIENQNVNNDVNNPTMNDSIMMLLGC